MIVRGDVRRDVIIRASKVSPLIYYRW